MSALMGRKWAVTKKRMFLQAVEKQCITAKELRLAFPRMAVFD